MTPKKYSLEYASANLFSRLNETLDPLNFVQTLNFPTWERMIRGVIKTSIFNHLFVNDFSIKDNIYSTKPILVDSLLVSLDVGNCCLGVQQEIWRTWQNCSKEGLLSELTLLLSNHAGILLTMWWLMLSIKSVSLYHKDIFCKHFVIILSWTTSIFRYYPSFIY